MTDAKVIRLERTLLLVWFVLNLILGALTVHEYGMSVDEPNNQHYAADTLNAYPSLFGILYEPDYYASYDGHGPAFITLAAIFVRIVQAIFPNIYVPDVWHYAYFITLPLTGLCVYGLTKRWFNPWTAWALMILLSTQPLLLGHAFINPKDTPFMFFLTLSVLWGFRMADGVSGDEPYLSLEKPAAALTEKFRRANPQRRRRFLIFFGLAIAVVLTLVLFSEQINTLIRTMVAFFYHAEPDTWASQLFSSVGDPNIPVEDYVTKALRLFHRLERGLWLASLLVFLAYFGLLIRNVTLGAFLRAAWTQRYNLGKWSTTLGTARRNSIKGFSIRTWLVEFFQALRNPPVLLAATALGLATGIRAIAPIAGVIVVLYLFAKVRSRAWTTSIAYFLVAGIVTYLAWPHLWSAPIRHYLKELGVISNFSTFPGRVLFNGRLYSVRDLPHAYLPTLLTIQFTETAVLCIYVGIGILTWRLLRNRLRVDLLLYIGMGLALPLFALILLNPTLYHNFRQALFLVPPMFVLAAFTLEWIFLKITQTWVRIILIAALTLPGVYSTVKLYPYEYVYYNSLVGGSAGAAHRFELDYWRISLREMALELNEVAAPGSLIVVTRSAGLLARYTRPDLVVDKPINSILDLDHGYDYIVQVTRGAGDGLYPEVNSLIVIERDGAVLATAKYVRDVSEKK